MNDQLKNMFGSTPESFRTRILDTINAQPSRTYAAPRLRTAMLCALCLMALTAVTLAAPKAADFFSAFFGEKKQEELSHGKIARVGESITFADAVFTLDEVVYTSNGLYGVGHISPANERVVLLSDGEYKTTDAAGYTIFYGEDSRPAAGAITYAELAAQNNARILKVTANLKSVGVNGGDMLTPGWYMFDMLPQMDGDVLFAFEIPTGVAVADGTTYEIQFSLSVAEMTPENETLDRTRKSMLWTVAAAPQYLQPTAAPAPVPVVTALPDGVSVTVPDAFAQNGTLPVYAAVPRTEENTAFFALDPTVFNQSGISEHLTRNEHYRHETYVFTDEARLSVSAMTMEYAEYDGEYTIFYLLEEGSDGPHPRPAFSSYIADLGHYAYWNKSDKLVHQELSGHTLSEAKALAESLLKQLDLDDYALCYALDMTTERIAALGAAHAKEMEDSFYYYDKTWDPAAATAADEGFFLLYKKQLDGMDIRDDDRTVRVFVSGGAIRSFHIDDLYRGGSVLHTPEKLLTAEEAAAVFARDNGKREHDGFFSPDLTQLTLMYMPARADDATGALVYMPVWHAAYSFTDAAQPCDGWAWYSAIDGKLLEDCY